MRNIKNVYINQKPNNIIERNDDFMTEETFQQTYNLKSPYNNQPVSKLTRLIAAFTALTVIASGSSALLGREPMSEEEKAAYARAKKAVVYTITEEGLIVNKNEGQSITYIRPAEAPTPKVIQKEAN